MATQRPRLRMFARPRWWAGWGWRCPHCEKKVLVSVEDCWDMKVPFEKFRETAEFMCPHCRRTINLKWDKKKDSEPT